MRHWLVLILFLLGLGTLRVVACGEDSCVEDDDCNDGNPCTKDYCPEPPLFDLDLSLCGADDEQKCATSRKGDGTPCGSGKVCVDGVCGENLCEGIVCDDGLDCTDDECDFKDGECRFTTRCNDGDPCTEDICSSVTGLCDSTTPAEDGTTCNYGEHVGICSAGVCVAACDPGSNQIYPCPWHSPDWYCCPGTEFCIHGGC
jgi:hypothetical protein